MEDAPMTAFHVMTFNINGAFPRRAAAKAWANRAGLNVRTILKHVPDLLTLQEVEQANLDTYRAELHGYNHIRGNCYTAVEPWQWTSIFWRHDRFTLVAAGEFWLSDTPDVPSMHWGLDEPHGVTWARLRCRDSGAEILLCNTHLEDGAAGEYARNRSAELLAARLPRMQGDAACTILAGDFNCNPDSLPHRTLRAAGFRDTYREAGNVDGAVSSFHGYEGGAYDARRWGGADPYWRVDWILVRDGSGRVEAATCAVARDAEPPVYPSDHYPVIAELDLRQGAQT
jgi:endonuclease/exonuclease/phosphatase family metal-dependent hydrolase